MIYKYKKFLIIANLVLLLIIIIELVFLLNFNFNKDEFYSLNTVSNEKDYQKWRNDNIKVTKSRFVNTNSGQIIVNDTYGIIKKINYNTKKKEILITLETKDKNKINFKFSKNTFKAYDKSSNPDIDIKGPPIEIDKLKIGDYVLIHESFRFVDGKIKPLEAGLAKL